MSSGGVSKVEHFKVNKLNKNNCKIEFPKIKTINNQIYTLNTQLSNKRKVSLLMTKIAKYLEIYFGKNEHFKAKNRCFN
jgi:hypothetical protein